MSAFAFSLVTIAAAEDTTFDPDSVTPGAVGFLMTGVFALAVILLGVNLVRRMRRNTYRAEIREQLEAEAAAGAGSGQAESGAAESGAAGSGSTGADAAEAGDAGTDAAGPAADERGRDS